MKDDQKKTKGRFLSFAVDEEMSQRIKAEASADGLTASSWVRFLVIRALRERDREAERQRRGNEGNG